jgi:hypothetical protein
MNSDYWSLIIAVIALIWGFIMGIPTIKSWVGSITPRIYFVVDEDINLREEIKKGIEGLDITFNGVKVNENSYLLKAFIFYIGKDDIVRDNVKKNLNLQLPEGSIIHDHKILFTKNDLEIKSVTTSEIIDFDFDLIKDKEYFYFELFATLGKSNIPIPYKLNYRIINIKPSLITSYSALMDKSIFNFTYWFPFMIVLFVFLETFILRIQVNAHNFDTIFYSNGNIVNIDSIMSFTTRKSAVITPGNITEESAQTKVDSLGRVLYETTNQIDDILLSTDAYTRSDSLIKNGLFRKYSDYYLLVNGELGPIKLNEKYSVKYTYGNLSKIAMISAYVCFTGGTIAFFLMLTSYFSNHKLKYMLNEIKKFKAKKINDG